MELKDICQYITEKVDVGLYQDNYISTENMLPDKGGITSPSSIPSGKGTKYQKGDILISNIRPYFKKVWQANNGGCCSNDVLCFRSNGKVSEDYLFYLLSQDRFFDYMMSGAKGSKMPRGDKQQIMEWKIELPSFDDQRKISSILSSLDSKIETNNKLNAKLEELAQTIFKSWFVDFEPFKDQKMVESELGLIPEGWKVGNIFDVADIFDSQRKPLSGNVRDKMEKIYPYYGATSCMDYVDNYIFDGTYTLMGEDGSVVKENGLPFMQYIWGKMWVNNHAHVLQGKNGFSTEMIHCMLSQMPIKHLVTGAVQLKLSQGSMRKIKLAIPPISVLDEIRPGIDGIYTKLRTNEQENQRLVSLRDTLLPKLMSGEIVLRQAQEPRN